MASIVGAYFLFIGIVMTWTAMIAYRKKERESLEDTY